MKGILSGSAITRRGFCQGLQLHEGDFVRVCNYMKGILSGSAITRRGFCQGLQLHEGDFVWILSVQQWCSVHAVNNFASTVNTQSERQMYYETMVYYANVAINIYLIFVFTLYVQ